MKWALLPLMLTLVAGPRCSATETLAPRQLGPGDRLSIAVFGQPELSGDVIVDRSGSVHLPLIGDVSAAHATTAELELRVSAALAQGYVHDPKVTVKVLEYRPIFVLGLVRSPGQFTFREGLSVLGAIALAGGIGRPEERRSGIYAESLQAEERVRQLQLTRAALTLRKARLLAQQEGRQEVDFPAVDEDRARTEEIEASEGRDFDAEREAEKQETEALRGQIPTLEAEIESLKQQEALEHKQRELNHEMVVQYEQMLDTGLVRRPNYIEVKREEARIDANVERLRTETLRAQQTIGDVTFKIGELHDWYRRRALAALQETERSLRELAISLPAAIRLRDLRSADIVMAQTTAPNDRPMDASVTVIRGGTRIPVSKEALSDIALDPGDVVQVGALLSPLSSVSVPSGVMTQAEQ